MATIYNDPLPLNLIFFTSTKGHFGHKDIYQHTLNHLKKQINLESFKNKVAHIKVSPSEQDIADEMSRFLREIGFDYVLMTTSDWSHNGNHGEEYTKDIQKVLNFMSQNDMSEYSLWMEDDYIFDIKQDESLNFYFNWGINALKYNYDLLTVRFNLDIPDESKIKKYDALLYLQKKDYTKYGVTNTFQPTIYRTKDLWWAYCVFLKNNWEKLKHTHIELRSGYSLFPLTNSPMPFAEFHCDIVKSVHIGTEDYKEILKKYE